MHYVYLPSLTFVIMSKYVNIIFGVSLIIIGSPILLIPAFTIDKYFNEGKLCTKGIYSFIRHPIYASWIVFIVPGIILIFGLILGISIPIFMYIIFKILIIEEEQYLEKKLVTNI